MSEAKPSNRRGGHAYGRRNLQMSNTAEEGELCITATRWAGSVHHQCDMTVTKLALVV